MSFEKETKEVNLRTYKINMEAEEYSYTTGNLGEQFFLKIKNEGKLTAAYCDKCNVRFLPVRGFCILCGNEVKSLVYIDMEGVVESFTIAKISSKGEEFGKEKIIAYIKFPNTLGGLLHELKNVKIEELKIGMKVHPVFKEMKERIGSLTDISYFEPKT